MTHPAVLVIDVQQSLCEGPDAAWDVPGTLTRINTVTARARAAEVPVLFIQHEGRNGYLEHGTPGWQLAAGLTVLPGDPRLRKTTPDSFHHTDLQALLQARGVDALVICGMHSEFCVDTTTRRAMALGYPVTLVADGHTSAGNVHLAAAQVIAHHNATLGNITSFGPRARVAHAEDIHFSAPKTVSP